MDSFPPGACWPFPRDVHEGLDTTNLEIFVGGLSPTDTSQDLYDIFVSFGPVIQARVIPDASRVRTRCCGYVKLYQ